MGQTQKTVSIPRSLYTNVLIIRQTLSDKPAFLLDRRQVYRRVIRMNDSICHVSMRPFILLTHFHLSKTGAAMDLIKG